MILWSLVRKTLIHIHVHMPLLASFFLPSHLSFKNIYIAPNFRGFAKFLENNFRGCRNVTRNVHNYTKFFERKIFRKFSRLEINL